MKYLTGETVELGDLVLIESGKTLGVVYAIIETPEDALSWGLMRLVFQLRRNHLD
ncbi:hypothetical protein Q095_01709 [Pseudomonas aeruginosa PS50]|jgi:hypothetical protein|nr:hypothetical protein CIA_03432 [Pseudomonas aeruginosa PA14]ERV34074.1 hypothetical protein Q070_00785 [Pseudomonas aeruginosa BL16]ERV95003.1 hypothetical protein Q040_00876 [Pseudomonas aeruginosa BWHPSA027]ERV99109.1 hypothetical protein Q039_00945 [Pseudomonas aeruginosa BWHPSA026]ETU78796.1 hypothetical protein Q095_01709 [Pseudomonas aeruginosa PS50]ETV18885.1 hypothetical protein Q049_01310 [Pseudomonas aeruginosa BWHPSA044]EZO63772.1 hypothetical protein V559_01686 [Pseudomonas aer